MEDRDNAARHGIIVRFIVARDPLTSRQQAFYNRHSAILLSRIRIIRIADDMARFSSLFLHISSRYGSRRFPPINPFFFRLPAALPFVYNFFFFLLFGRRAS